MVIVMKGLVCGVGVNDSDYVTGKYINGVMVRCRFYSVWKDMLTRCYSEKSKRRKPTYAGCTVCEEWLTFSNFKRWMKSQDWEGKEIDKDILIQGSKLYSPETCAFVDRLTNMFVTGCRSSAGGLPTGVCWHKNRNCFVSNCKNPFSKKIEHLGCYDCADEAYKAWRKRKHELACKLADMQTNILVSEALRARYA